MHVKVIKNDADRHNSLCLSVQGPAIDKLDVPL